MKTCRKYLNGVQNSVFEGELTSAEYKRLLKELKDIIDKSIDSILFYEINNMKWLKNNHLGIIKNDMNNML
jgi:CRISPR-associated protein Cas2